MDRPPSRQGNQGSLVSIVYIVLDKYMPLLHPSRVIKNYIWVCVVSLIDSVLNMVS